MLYRPFPPNDNHNDKYILHILYIYIGEAMVRDYTLIDLALIQFILYLRENNYFNGF